MAEVVLKDIRKSYGEVETLHGINLGIRNGEFVAFVGPSGCGKSTLLRTIAGLEDITAGDLFINQRRVNTLPPAMRGVAMVFQSYALFPHMTVADNMAFGLKLAGVPKPEMREAVGRAASILQIEHLLDRKPKALSGGQRQRVAIGRAIVRIPDVFLFDEPLSNLDAALRVQMRIEIAKLHRELGTTMVYVTHDQIEAMTLADRIVVLQAGRIEQVGEPLELYHHPANMFVAGFIGSPKMNFLPAEIETADARQASVRLPDGERISVWVDARRARFGDMVTLGVRPEHLSVGKIPAENGLAGQALAQEKLGDMTYLYLRAGGLAEPVTVRAAPDTRLALGDPVKVHLPPDHCYLFDAQGKAFTRHAAHCN